RVWAHDRILDVLQVGHHLPEILIDLAVCRRRVSQKARKPSRKVGDLDIRLQRLLFGVSTDQAGYRTKDQHACKPLLENEQRILCRLFLNYRQSHKVPVDTEFCLLLLARNRKMHLRQISCIDRLTLHRELLFKYTQFSESLRELKSNDVLVDS